MIATTDANALHGLTTQEAQQRLHQYGPNEVPEEHPRKLLVFLRKLWGAVPWMLEATILFQLILGKYVDAVITSILLLANAVISYTQESNAQASLELLQKKLTIQVRVLRDNRWQLIPARELVPGDPVRLRVGDMVPADIKLLTGELSADQSALTGESLPKDILPGGDVYAASVVKRGDGIGVVTGTGVNTFFGKTARLVQTAKTISHGERTIQEIVKYLMILNALLVAAMVVYSLVEHLPITDVVPFILILLVASIPVALPATFTLATALGSQELARRGVLATRLSAIKEAASMDVLCSDKTGTITRNEMTVAGTHPYGKYSDDDLLRFAAFASDSATHDPIDMAVIAAANEHRIELPIGQQLQFIPFDPSTKRTEAIILADSQRRRVIKGFPQIIGKMIDPSGPMPGADRLSTNGYRTLAVAEGPEQGPLHLVGLVDLQDPPREDSARIIQRLRALGVHVLMITGDGLETARAIAAQVGITGKATTGEILRTSGSVGDYEVFSGVFPEDKFRLVEALQKMGHIVGMTGDGVNDAPALRQAEVGAAVANATDIAKSAAGIVLLDPGLSNLLSTVEVGRRIYQRMLTYTLNKIVKTFQVALFLSLGLIMMGIFVTRPTLILLLLLANDFVTMSLTTDRVQASGQPNQWHVRPLVASGLILAGGWLLVSFAVVWIGQRLFAYDLDHLQTLVFLMLVFTGQANVYLIRERRHFWSSRPSRWMLISTSADIIIVIVLAARGILMSAIDPVAIFGLLVLVVAVMVPLDVVKVIAFRRFGLVADASESPAAQASSNLPLQNPSAT